MAHVGSSINKCPVDLNPGEQVDELTYHFEKNLLIPYEKVVAGAVLSLYMRYTPTFSEHSLYGVYDAYIIEGVRPEEIESSDSGLLYVRYFVNKNPRALSESKNYRASLVADEFLPDSTLKDPASFGDPDSGFFASRREYQGEPTPDLSAHLDRVLASC